MEKNVAIFVSNDKFSKIACEKLIKDGYNIFPVAIQKTKNFESFLIEDLNLIKFFDFLDKRKINFFFFAGRISQNKIFDNLHPSAEGFLKKVKVFRTEEILKKFADLLEEKGIKVIPIVELFKEEICQKKIYTYRLTEEEKENLIEGFSILKSIAKYNIGQSLIIKNRMILGIEGIEGTDEFIKRIGKFCKNFIFIKGCDEKKDLRFDLPVIGIKTIKNLTKYGCKVIGLKAGKTIILEKRKIIQICKLKKIKLVGVE